MPKKKIAPKVFNIKTYKGWAIKRTSHHEYQVANDEELLMEELDFFDNFETISKPHKFTFRLELNDMRVNLCVIYNDKVVMYRGELSEKMKKFWHDLGDYQFKTESRKREQMQNQCAKDFDWDFS